LIVGFCLGFEPPSYGVIMEALRHAILPKTYLAQRYPKVKGIWPCCGLPEKLVCDRGPDLTSQDLEDAAFQLGIELDFNPPRTPHLKGTVESFFDGLNDQLSSSLPGRTFRNWVERADYKPDQGPLLSYEGLLEIIHLYLVDVYSLAKHPMADQTRLEMWQDSAATQPPALPASAEELLVLMAKRVQRTLTVRGIELSGMYYASDELMALRSELAASNLQVDRFSVRYNPWDLGAVWVTSPLDGKLLKAPALDPVMQGMTEYQWRVLKRAVRDRFDGPEHQMTLAAGRNAIRDVVEETLQKPSGRRRVRAMRYLQGTTPLSQEAAESGELETPLDAAAAQEAPPATTPAMETTSPAEPPAEGESSPDPVPPLSPEDIDVSDWEVTSPGF
jgi:putative transposase